MFNIDDCVDWLCVELIWLFCSRNKNANGGTEKLL